MRIKAVFAALILCVLAVSCTNYAATRDKPKPGKDSGKNSGNTGQNTGNTGGAAKPDTGNWPKSLDTARNVTYLSAFEKDVIFEMNMVRSDPKKYAALYMQPKSAGDREGIAALNKAGSAPPLQPEKGLCLAAQAHTKDQGRTGQFSHTGSDKSEPAARARRFGKFSGTWGFAENIVAGSGNARVLVCMWLASTGHRNNIMNGKLTQVGVGYGPHPKYGGMCTAKYAFGYISN